MGKMTTLTIEHLAAYLPYDVGAKWNKYPRKRFKLQGVLYGKPWLIDSSSCTEKAQIHDIKLILRPISQLTVPITHNGETFEPLYELGDRRADERMGYNDHYIDYTSPENSGKGIDWLNEPWFIVQYLLEWHFDVFGLIEAGLAVAMNPDGTIA